MISVFSCIVTTPLPSPVCFIMQEEFVGSLSGQNHFRGNRMKGSEGQTKYGRIVGVVLLYWCVSWLAIGMNKYL